MKINRVLLLFLFVISISIGITWQIIHTEYFANIIAKNVTNFLKKKINSEVKMNNVALMLFPPGIAVNGLEFKNFKKKGFSFNVSIDEAEVIFDLFKSTREKIGIKRLEISEGDIKVTADINSGKSEKSDYNTNTILEIAKDVPVTEAILNNIDLKFNQYQGHIKFSKIINIEKNIFSEIFLYPQIENIPMDALLVSARLIKDKIIVENIKVESNGNVLNANGEVKGDIVNNPIIKAKFKADVKLESHYLYHNLNDFHKLSGDLLIDGTFDYSEKFNVKSSLKVKNISSDYFFADSIKIDTHFDENKVSIKNLYLNEGTGKLKTNNEFIVYDFNTKKIMPEKVDISVEKIKLNTALYILRKSLKPLKGELTGDLNFDLDGLNFVINTKDNFEINNLRIDINNSDIVRVEKAKLEKATFALKDLNFYMKAKAILNDSDLNIEGEAKSDSLYFSVLNSKINLEDFGKIGGLDFKGVGRTDLIVDGPYDDVSMKFNLSLRNAEFEKFYLGRLRRGVNLRFKENKVYFDKLEGRVGSTNYTLNGFVDYDDLEIKLAVNMPSTNYIDTTVIHTPLLKGITWLPDRIGGNYRLNYNTSGHFNKPDFKVFGGLTGKNINILDEAFRNLKFDFSYNPKDITFSNILVRKERSSLKAEIKYDFKSSGLQGKMKSFDSSLSDFVYYNKLPFKFKSKFEFETKFDFIKKNEASLSLKLHNSKVENNYLFNSDFNLNIKDKKLSSSLNFIGNNIILNSEMDLSSGKVRLEGETNIARLELLMEAFLGIQIEEKNAKGRLFSKISSTFNYKDISKLDAEIELSDIYIRKSNILLTNNGRRTFKIKKGKINKWDYTINGDNSFLSFNGSGNLGGKYNINLDLNYDANLIELLSPRIIKAKGYIKNKFHFFGDKESSFNLITESKNLELLINNFPAEIKKADYKLVVDDKKFSIQKCNIQTPQGKMIVSGGAELTFPFPSLSINYSMDKVDITPYKKTNMVITGVGSILGDKLPYVISGDVSIDKFNSKTELSDIEKGGEQTSIANKYLPKVMKQNQKDIFKLNVAVNTASPLLINNSMIDLGLVGETIVRGNIFDPRLSGRFTSVPGIGKLYFKNNEFIISKGDIKFLDSNSYKNPEIDVTADSIINEYKVKLRVYGSVEDYKLDLSSEPSLSDNDILSLIAFGYTDDDSKNLSDIDRQSLSSAGIGSILFSRFKITDTLKKSFGIKLNLGTEIDRTSNNVISGNQSGSNSQVGQVRSATKIELQKRLHKNLKIEYTSTLGGSISQRRSLKLNYKLDDNKSLELIREDRSNVDDTEGLSQESIGLDYKVKWTKP